MDIYLIGEVGFEITLDTVLNQVKGIKEDEALNVHIHSGGGSVYDGLAIYNYLKNLPNEVNTYSSGLVASIASVIFLAGKERVINNTDNFLIHLPMAFSGGNAKDIEKTAKELRSIEDKIAGVYAMETDLTVEEAKEIMEKDEFLAVDFLKSKNFVTEIREFKAVATLTNRKMENSITEEKVNSLFKNFENKLKKFFSPKNKIVTNAEGKDVDFYELEDGEAVVVGAKARIDGEDAEGEILMPSGETYIFEGGELIEIKEVEGDEEEDSEAEMLKKENETLKQEIEDLKNKSTELENKVSEVEEVKNEMLEEFKNFKASITSDFAPSKKVEEPKKNTRSLNIKK